MGIFTKAKEFLFGKTENTEQEIQEEPKKEIAQCCFCQNPIYDDERYSKQQGKIFHKRCYKEFKRLCFQ